MAWHGILLAGRAYWRLVLFGWVVGLAFYRYGNLEFILVRCYLLTVGILGFSLLFEHTCA